MEPYFYLVKKPRFRNAIARFRCSSHTLEKERGRHTNPKTPVADRVCVHCKVIEHEKHFLLQCDINAFERQCFYEKISKFWWVYLSKWRRTILVWYNKCQFTIFILVRWISLSVVWKNKWICNMPATHRGRVTHICATKLDHPSLAQIIDLSPVRRQAIIWTNADILRNGFYGTISIEILIESRAFSVKKHFKMSPTKWLSFCLGISVLDTHHQHQLNVAEHIENAVLRLFWTMFNRHVFCNIFQVMWCTCLIFYSTILCFNVPIWHLYFILMLACGVACILYSMQLRLCYYNADTANLLPHCDGY